MKTPSPSANVAAHAVSSTNELLCSIVAYLPFNDIVAATSICRTWRNALAINPIIHQKLFLKPREIREVMAESDFVRDTENPIPMDKYHVIGIFHPLIDKICGTCSIEAGAYEWDLMGPAPFPRFDHYEGSWRDMFVTQPPCKSVTLRIFERSSDDSRFLDFKTDKGMKLGELYDFIDTFPECNSIYTKGRVCINNYATEEYLMVFHGWTIKCQTRNGHVCRPEMLPLSPQPFVDSDDSDDSDVSDSDSSSLDDEETAIDDEHS
jgi:hypothetical protein